MCVHTFPGERRIRVHTLSLPVSDQLPHLYARANVLAITGTLANMGTCVGVCLCVCVGAGGGGGGGGDNGKSAISSGIIA